MLGKVFRQAVKNRTRLGDVCKELYDDGHGSDQLILKQALHYRLAVAPGLDYWESLEASLRRLENSN